MKFSFGDKRRIDSLDVLKCLACIAVVLIHYPFAGKDVPVVFSSAVKVMCRFAVPLFFAISGYFCLDGDGQLLPASKLVAKIRHIFKIGVWASLFYYAFILVRSPMMDPTWTWSAYWRGHFDAIHIIRFFLTTDPFCHAHLWFLMGLILCYLTMLFVDSRCKMKVLLCSAPVLLVAFSLMQEFKVIPSWFRIYGVQGGGIVLCNNYIFRALPFFAFGLMMKVFRRLLRELRIPVFLLPSLVVLGLCCSVGEMLLLENASCQFYFGSYVTAFSLLLWGIRADGLEAPCLAFAGRELSLYVYILHIACAQTLVTYGKFHHWWGKSWYEWAHPLMTIGLSFAIAFLVFEIKALINRRFGE